MWRQMSTFNFFGVVLCLLSNMVLAASPDGVAESLQKALVEQGWQSTTASDGSRIFTPPDSSVGEALNRDAAETPRARPNLPDSLIEALDQQGWRMTKDAAGNTIVTPPELTSNEINTMDKAPVSENTSVSGSLLRELNRQGWSIRRGADGSYTATHPAVTVTTGSPSEASIYGNSAGTSISKEPSENSIPTDSLAKRLDRALRQSPAARYWQSNIGQDGSIILHPVARAVNIKNASTSGTKGMMISDESGAASVAMAWLAGTETPGLALIGKVRKVPRAYVVSIVARHEPHRLLHVIAVRARDGRVLVID